MTAVQHSFYMAVRHLKALWRQPIWIAVTLAQPIVWLLLYGALFKKVVQIPGFRGGSYIEFLTPGVIVMTAMFSGGWNGMTMIEDLDRGIIDRFLVSRVRRSSLIFGRVAQTAATILLQSLIIVGLALIVGAHFGGGVAGLVVLAIVAALLGAAFGALSNGFALIARREESLIGAVQFVLLPLTFLSAAFMQLSLVPAWIRHVADFNPANWAVVAGRSAMSSDVDWGVVGARVGYLLALLAVAAVFATRAFRSYQGSV
jgi:ABC-2 type transport system permease protein